VCVCVCVNFLWAQDPVTINHGLQYKNEHLLLGNFIHSQETKSWKTVHKVTDSGIYIYIYIYHDGTKRN
jgi:hypothetical protein